MKEAGKEVMVGAAAAKVTRTNKEMYILIIILLKYY